MIQCGVRFDHLDDHQHLLALYAPFYQIVRELAVLVDSRAREALAVQNIDLVDFSILRKESLPA
jgi:hypothetical protein